MKMFIDVPRSTSRSPIGSRTGAWFTLSTVIGTPFETTPPKVSSAMMVTP